MTKRRRRATAPRDPNALVPHATVLALDPAVLHDQSEDAVRALLREGESVNTRRSYAGALRYWAAWFRLRYRQALALPVPVPAVLQFLVDHVERSADDGTLIHELPDAIDEALVEGGFKGESGAPALNTVLHRLSVLSKARAPRTISTAPKVAGADGVKCDGGIPPASRNHRTPTAGDTPALTAASSLSSPAATATQNCCRFTRRPTVGRPGERNLARPARSDRRLRIVIATSIVEVSR